MTAAPDSTWVTLALVASSVAMFVACMWSARLLIGWTGAWGFAALALPMGWFAEQMGSSRGWFFGSYHYTDVLGPKLGDVPLAIPLMWFALTWLATVMASLILWRRPVAQAAPGQAPTDAAATGTWGTRIATAWLAAMIVTAFDLGADPYFVYVLHAWIMTKTDGGWFGETLEGFVGWMVVSFIIILLAQARVQPQPPGASARQLRLAVLVPLLIYASGIVFQMLFGQPVEVRAVAFFAMGIPLVSAAAAWWGWQATLPQPAAPSATADTGSPPLDPAAHSADPLADRAVASLVGPWSNDANAIGPGLARLNQATRCTAEWRTNADLATWAPANPDTDPRVSAALRDYLAQGRVLPDWADPARIARTEALFMAQGPLSCTLLFCASLPQCYVMPALAEVLHIAGQLEAHTEYRVRQTAAMIFPVMMQGGLTTPGGSGVAQVLKVRLVHATIRHLILHGEPGRVQGRVERAGLGNASQSGMQAALMAHGWDIDRAGLPCSQLELAYTLLTFSYVFLKGMRTMGLGLSREDEEAFLHTWNVMAHVLGVRRDLMAHTMDEAQALFDRMQAWGRARPVLPDARPALGRALADAMARTIRVPVVRNIPVPLTRWLIGAQAAGDIGLDQRLGLPTRLLFALGRGLTGAIDGVARLFAPRFSLSRLVTRVIGYHVLSNFLLDQTRPIGLPDEVLNPLHETVAAWSDDPHASGWMNRLEDLLTTRGAWRAGGSGRPPASG